jgi:hypothetical protein
MGGQSDFANINRRQFLTTSAAASVPLLAGTAEARTDAPPQAAPGTFRLVREIPVQSGYDLLVAGGGPAGVAAAVSAARSGAKVLLIEATGCLGGMGTSGLVSSFDPMGNGKENLVRGLMLEIVGEMFRRGFVPYQDQAKQLAAFHHWTHFNPEGYKVVLDDFVQKAGVEVRLFTKLIDADADRTARTVRSVVVHDIEGYHCLAARMFVDATGDAVLADLVGAECRRAGRDTPHIMPPTLTSIYCGMHRGKYGEGGIGKEVYAQGMREGAFSQLDYYLQGLCRQSEEMGYLNAIHLFGVDPLRAKDRTRAMIEGRRRTQEIVNYFRKHLPGCETLELAATGALLGVRESRQIVGEYELTGDDLHDRREFPDTIGVYCKFVDIHHYEPPKPGAATTGDAGKTMTVCPKPGEHFSIPYSVLVPRGWKNLWAAGRCLSADVVAHGSARCQPYCSMMGQAAGTAAAQCLRTGQTACDLDTETLIVALRQGGAYLPQNKLSKQMTRNHV